MEYWDRPSPRVKAQHIDKFREDLESCDDANVVLTRVKAAGQVGLGIVAYPVEASVDWTGVKCLSIKDANGQIVTPQLAPVMQPDYPIADTIVLYVHPNAVEKTRQFVQLCLSEKAAEVCSQSGLLTPWHCDRAIRKAQVK